MPMRRGRRAAEQRDELAAPLQTFNLCRLAGNSDV